MVTVLPVTSLYAGLHAVVYAVLSFRVALCRGKAIEQKKSAESLPDFKPKNAVSVPSTLTFARQWNGFVTRRDV
jgi:hypothetical protein